MKQIKKQVLYSVAIIVMLFIIMPMKGQAQDAHVLNPNKEIDNLEQLSAGMAERNSRVTILNYGFPKYFWVNNFGQDPENDYLEWKVMSGEEIDYFAWLHLKAEAGTEFQIEVFRGEESIDVVLFEKQMSGWEVVEFGELKIPAGNSRIRLTKISTDTRASEIKGLDIIRNSDKGAYEQRILSYKEKGSGIKTKFSNSDYGLFFQYGVWGYPEFGDKKDKESATNDFDVNGFVDMLETTDTKFIIWSLTWWQYRMQMPVGTVDSVLGHNQFTTERNLVGEIAKECKKRDIGFYLYYHQGLQQEPEWKNKQNFPANFSETGGGDKTLFFNNWKNVISEIGTNLGTDLDGWFFDDGCVYYPAPFEELAKATKAGNPNRIISYNSWEGTAVTPFQDMTFGEGTWGEEKDTAEGILQSGKEKGLLQVGMPMVDNGNWGITSANETIIPTAESNHVIDRVKSAHTRKVPMALNIKMWEDGTIGADTMKLLLDVKNEFLGEETYPIKSIKVNAVNGAYDVAREGEVQLAANIKPQYATSKEVIWNVTDVNGNATSLASITEEGLLTVGESLGSIKVTVRSKENLEIMDSAIFQIKVMPERSTVYGNDENIEREGVWTVREGSKSCDSTEKEATVSYKFTADYIEWYGVVADDHGIANIYIDGEYVTNVDCYSTERKTDTLLFRSSKLEPGEHTITIEVQELKNQSSSSTYIEVYKLVLESTKKLDATIVLEDQTITYTGKPIVIKEAVTTPKDLEIEYAYAKKETRAITTIPPSEIGTYEIIATFKGDDNYNSQEVRAKLEIKKKKSTEEKPEKEKPGKEKPGETKLEETTRKEQRTVTSKVSPRTGDKRSFMNFLTIIVSLGCIYWAYKKYKHAHYKKKS